MRPVRAFCPALAVLCGSACIVSSHDDPAASMPAPDKLGSIHWRADLKVLADTLSTKHKNAFSAIAREQFDQRVADLDRRLDGMSDVQAYAEFCKLVASIGDGHTRIFEGYRLTPHLFPLQFVWLADGIFITATTEEHRPLLQARVLKIGDTSLDAVCNRLSELVSHDNESGLRSQLPDLLNNGDLLHALGLIEQADTARLTIAPASGDPREIVMKSVARLGTRLTASALAPLADNLPISRRPREGGRLYGHAPLPDSQSLYVWYDSCANQPGQPTVSQFADDVLKTIDSTSLQRVVIDLRRNSGGNNQLLKSLIRGLARRPVAKQQHLFALIGRSTFSSAMDNALDLRRDAHAILIGEPTGGKPNSYGEVKSERLASSGLRLQYSTKYFHHDPENRAAVEPDVLIVPRASDFFSPRDVVLDAALRHKP